MFTITNRNSNKRFDVPGVSLREGERIIQYYPNNGANQQWRITDVGGGYYRIVSRSSGLTLDIPGYSTADGTGLTQWLPNGGGNQQWQIIRL